MNNNNGDHEMTTPTLAPCPFCGDGIPASIEEGGYTWLQCIECDSRGPEVRCDYEQCDAKLKAARLWNQRPLLDAVRELRIHLEEVENLSQSKEKAALATAAIKEIDEILATHGGTTNGTD